VVEGGGGGATAGKHGECTMSPEPDSNQEETRSRLLAVARGIFIKKARDIYASLFADMEAIQQQVQRKERKGTEIKAMRSITPLDLVKGPTST